MDALILAGGLGTRLRSVVTDRAKSVALVDGRPFLSYVLAHLAQSGRIDRVVLCVGHRAQTVRECFGQHFEGMTVEYSEEDAPLGTGGALRKAIAASKPSRPFLAMNGDTVLKLRIDTFADFHQAQRADLTLALSYVTDAVRFGTASLQGDRITGFVEKGGVRRGWINAGMYLFSPRAAGALLAMPERFSLESDFFSAHLESLNCAGYRSRAAFLDIGVPEDYHRAAALLRG